MDIMNKPIRMIKSVGRKSHYIYTRWKYFYKKAKGNPITLVFPGGITYCLYPWGQITEVLYGGGFERTELELTAQYLKEGMNVIDAGANIGLYSILAAKLVGESGRVWAFEPSTETYERLLKNLSLNGLDSVIANKLALSDIADGEILLQKSPGCGDAERYLSVYPDHPSIHNKSSSGPGEGELVKVTNLDSYMEKNLKNVRIDFIKVDVEGSEYAVLRGAKKLLLSNPDVLLLFECTREGCQWSGQKMVDVFNFLRSMDFELFGWDNNTRKWESDQEFLSRAGNLWACRDRKRLPRFKSRRVYPRPSIRYYVQADSS